MAQREQLQILLEGLVPSPGKVYFQAPPANQMVYPCIVYNKDNAGTKFADNGPYRFTWRYQVTVIDQDPDSQIPDKVALLPMCLFNRYFVANNLNHYVFILYF